MKQSKSWILRTLYGCWVIASLSGCMKSEPAKPDPVPVPQNSQGLFISNEGNVTAGNASLSYYDLGTKTVEQEVFFRTNGFKLGDAAQSMVIRDSLGYIVVNNSGAIFVINVNTFKYVGKITGLTSPRYIHFVSDEKAYVTDLMDYNITVFNPKTLEKIKKIDVKVEGKTQPSTEQMVQWGDYLFTNCWSYDDKILVIDTRTDKVVDQIKVGIQPTSLVIDKFNKIWTITDGGYQGSPFGYEAPAIYRIDAATRKVEKVWKFNLGDSGSEIAINGTQDTVYYLSTSVWRMRVTDTELPTTPFVKNTTKHYWYGLTVDPYRSEVYVADAIDYVQSGRVYRYTPQGTLLDDFAAGVIPGAFCFK